MQHQSIWLICINVGSDYERGRVYSYRLYSATRPVGYAEQSRNLIISETSEGTRRIPRRWVGITGLSSKGCDPSYGAGTRSIRGRNGLDATYHEWATQPISKRGQRLDYLAVDCTCLPHNFDLLFLTQIITGNETKMETDIREARIAFAISAAQGEDCN